MISYCIICPQNCQVDRKTCLGFCGRTDQIEISKHMKYYWEEPPLCKKNGTGAIFFTGCNLGCVFCQNYLISRRNSKGTVFTDEELYKLFSDFESQGMDSIDLVSPTQYSHILIPLLKKFKDEGHSIPVIWNSNSYEHAETIEKLNGLVDVFLPDLKFFSPELSGKLCKKEDYFKVALKAIDKMVEICPDNRFDESGLMKKGVIIRHLILPNHTADSINILRQINDRFGNDVILSLMCQYIPEGIAPTMEGLNRRLKRKEYQWVLNAARSLGFRNIYIQDFAAASESFIPDFMPSDGQ